MLVWVNMENQLTPIVHLHPMLAQPALENVEVKNPSKKIKSIDVQQLLGIEHVRDVEWYYHISYQYH